MRGRISAPAGAVRLISRVAVATVLICFPARYLFAVSCDVVKHNPPSDADKAFLAADYAKAESLYKADLTAHPGNVAATEGLVHVLLREQKVVDADDAVKEALEAASNPTAGSGAPASPAPAAVPKSGALLTLRGEVEFRQGEPWLVEPTVLASYKLDPCNPRTRLLFARYSAITSRYATARQQILLAHQFDPADPEIRLAWIGTLPLAQRISEMEAYLSVPTGDDPETLRRLHTDLERWKKNTGEPPRSCRLVSTNSTAEIPFINLLGYNRTTRAFGVQVSLNGNPTRLQLGAGEGGLTTYRSIAERAKLKSLSQPESNGPGAKPSYTAYADSIKVGNLEFKDCVVKVIDAPNPNDDGDGVIGMDVFSDFLVTIDYPLHKVQVGPLPQSPAQGTAHVATLKTQTAPVDDPEIPNAGPVDRYIAPEMKDYTQIYRVANGLILPAALNSAQVKLFILDLGAATTNISPGAAMDVTKVHEKDTGIGKILIADEITYNFAHMSQKVNGVVAAETSTISNHLGMNISGFIGANTFSLLVMHIDYRDGLVKFDYIPDRGYKF